MLNDIAHRVSTHFNTRRIGVTSGIFLFNEPLKQYWEQKESRDAAGVDAAKLEPITGKPSTIEDGNEVKEVFQLGHPKQ